MKPKDADIVAAVGKARMMDPSVLGEGWVDARAVRAQLHVEGFEVVSTMGPTLARLTREGLIRREFYGPWACMIYA